MKTKIIKLQEIENRYESSVLVYGHFTTIHPGHIRYLNYAKKLGNKLIVSLMSDFDTNGNQKYAFSQKERAEALSLLSIVDIVLMMDQEELGDVIDMLKPNIIVLGKEYEKTTDPKIINALKIQKSNKSKVEFHAGEIHYASADLLLNSESELSNKRKDLFLKKCSKEKLKSNNLLSAIDSWNKTHLLVIGDTIIDQYAACEPLGLSAEAPVVVVKELKRKDFIGGAAIVASHINALGSQCTFLSVTGDDELANKTHNELTQQGINTNLIRDNSRPTTFKKRYIVENQKLFRVSRLEDHKLDKETEDLVISKLRKFASQVNGIVVSDFVYGVITENILEEIRFLSKKYDVPIFGDLQCSSQVGDITQLKDFSLLCPNEKETRIALKDTESGLEKLSQKIIDITNVEKLVMKLGGEGFIAYDDNRRTSHVFPALSVNPVDVAGAGDSLLAVMSIALASNQSLVCSSAIACCTASIAVETMGNLPISKEKLISKILNVFNN